MDKWTVCRQSSDAPVELWLHHIDMCGAQMFRPSGRPTVVPNVSLSRDKAQGVMGNVYCMTVSCMWHWNSKCSQSSPVEWLFKAVPGLFSNMFYHGSVPRFL